MPLSSLSMSVAAIVMMAPAATPGAADLATELLDKLAVATSEAEAQRLEEDLWDAWMHSGSPTIDILMQRGVEAMEAGDTDTAREMFDRCILIRPAYAEAWHRRAMLFYDAQQLDQAVADLEEVVRRNPRHFAAWIGLGRIFEGLDKPDAAIRAYREALKAYPLNTIAKQSADNLAKVVDGREL